MIYLQLFWSYIKIGFFGFGGGYAMLSLLQHEFVEVHGWLTAEEFTDIIAISQMTPGPIAINSATYIGYTATGNVWGSALATFAVCLPSFIMMTLVTRFYLKFRNNKHVTNIMTGLKPMVISMILAAALMLITPSNFVDYKSVIIFLVAVILSVKKINPIYLIICSGVAGYILYAL